MATATAIIKSLGRNHEFIRDTNINPFSTTAFNSDSPLRSHGNRISSPLTALRAYSSSSRPGQGSRSQQVNSRPDARLYGSRAVSNLVSANIERGPRTVSDLVDTRSLYTSVKPDVVHPSKSHLDFNPNHFGGTPMDVGSHIQGSESPLSYSYSHFANPQSTNDHTPMQLDDGFGRNIGNPRSSNSVSTSTDATLSSPKRSASALRSLTSPAAQAGIGAVMISNSFVKGGMNILQQKQAQAYQTSQINRATGYMKEHGIPWLPGHSGISTSQNSAHNSMTAHNTFHPESFPSGQFSQAYGVGDIL